jgi:carboxypeptidase C (cathepsin A)
LRRLALVLSAAALAAAAPIGALAQEAAHHHGAGPEAEQGAASAPTVRKTETLTLPGGPLTYVVTAGTIPIAAKDSGKVLAHIFSVGYTAGKAPDPSRPVTFVFNGGPGASSAYLHLGALGPLRLPFGRQGDGPSEPVKLLPNANTWLRFTDLVFVDPVGTGFSTGVGSHDEIADRFWNVSGDVSTLGAFVVRWLGGNRRRTSPVFLAGESYGGFRVVKLAHELQHRRGVGVRGLVMISPALDMSLVPSSSNSPLATAALLPSYAAAAREAGTVSGAAAAVPLSTVEDYAFGPYLADLLRGPGDGAAVDRMVANVARYTGLDPAFVRRYRGQVPPEPFLHALHRKNGRIGSPYDAEVTTLPLDPARPSGRFVEPVLEGSKAPLTSAMTHYLVAELGYPAKPTQPYEVLNEEIAGHWNWGRGPTAPEAVSTLRAVLALDPETRALIADGRTDLVTPYAAAKLERAEIEPLGDDPGRLERKVYSGGHMFYSRDDSRRAFTADVRALYQAALGSGGAAVKEPAAPSPAAVPPATEHPPR